MVLVPPPFGSSRGVLPPIEPDLRLRLAQLCFGLIPDSNARACNHYTRSDAQDPLAHEMGAPWRRSADRVIFNMSSGAANHASSDGAFVIPFGRGHQRKQTRCSPLSSDLSLHRSHVAKTAPVVGVMWVSGVVESREIVWSDTPPTSLDDPRHNHAPSAH